MFLGGEGSSSAVVLVMWPHTPPPTPPIPTTGQHAVARVAPWSHTQNTARWSHLGCALPLCPIGMCDGGGLSCSRTSYGVLSWNWGLFLAVMSVCGQTPSVARRRAPDEHLGSCHHSLWCLLLRTAQAQRTLPKSGLKIYSQRSRVPTSQQLDQTD